MSSRLLTGGDEDDDDYGSRGAGGSQRPAGKRGAPSGSQSSGSQKRVMRVDDSDEDSKIHASTAIHSTSSSLGAKSSSNIPQEDLERLVKDVVRLAIFTSHSDQALKRDDIKGVLDDHAKLFDVVFQKAQERLRDVFGMELVELITRGRKGQTNEKGAKAYILKNILPAELLASDVMDWTQDLEDAGLLMVILSLILVRQGSIYESALLSHMRRLSLLNDNSPFGDFQKKLDVLIRKRYLEKNKLEHMDESGEKAEMEYRWGARARAEVPEENIVKFIQEMFGREAPPGLEESIIKAAGIKAQGSTPAQEQP
ncbi:hypothetical protein EDD11_001345 [Mortierella claussenii]|nr:hypothetical protein EDD11_001345 [Mortierella claussenii]